ncbi:dimethylamine monooxygenase subunit DmmA family protein [Nocardia sp. NPDC001965]
MSQIDYSSIPVWARSPRPDPTPPDITGSCYLLVGIGPDAEPTVHEWSRALTGAAEFHTLLTADIGRGRTLLAAALRTARVGVRVRLAGSVGDCLALRATATSAGLEDDELQVAPTAPGTRQLFCAHCRAVTAVHTEIGDITACSGCEQELVVYHHVSRRTGQYLGYLAHGEEWSS